MEKLKIVINGNEHTASKAKELFSKLGYHISSQNRNNAYGWSLGDGIGDYCGNNVQSTLEERESQYGSFSDVAELTCGLIGSLVRPDMSFVQREALHMICSKLARIRCGDIDKIDSWHDIAGYATLVVQDLEKKAIDADKINQSDNRDWVEEIESSKD